MYDWHSLLVLQEKPLFLPTFTGMSSIKPVMVERMSVDEAEAFDFDTPSRTTSRLS